MSKQNRAMLEQTLLNLRFDMDCIGKEAEMYRELAAMTDPELEQILNELLAEM